MSNCDVTGRLVGDVNHAFWHQEYWKHKDLHEILQGLEGQNYILGVTIWDKISTHAHSRTASDHWHTIGGSTSYSEARNGVFVKISISMWSTVTLQSNILTISRHFLTNEQKTVSPTTVCIYLLSNITIKTISNYSFSSFCLYSIALLRSLKVYHN